MQFQPHCEQCFRTPFDGEDDEFRKFLSCEVCKSAFFCSESCQSAGLSEHQKHQCSDLKEHILCESLKRLFTMQSGDLAVQMPMEHSLSFYQPLSSCRSWKDYFDFSENPLADCIDAEFKAIPGDETNLTAWRGLKLATDATSFILTILAGLEHSIQDLADRTTLTIHIVGASQQEFKLASMNEELLHWLPQLQHLTIGYIGPDFVHLGNELLSATCCPQCTATGRSRHMFGSDILYHDFCDKDQLSTQYPPDLLIAFNSGHADTERDRWTPTLGKLIQMGIPVVFTTYNRHEAMEEADVLRSLGAAFTLHPEENRWRGMLPYFETFATRYELYYHNYWWYAVMGRTQHI